MNVSEFKIKEQICDIGRRLYAKGFAAANDGNITYRLNDKEILCTPTMVSKGFLKPEDICRVDYEGKQLAGTRKRTSEVLLHLAVYKNRPDVNAVVHCHPPHATAFAVAGEPIPKCILPEVEVFLGEVPINMQIRVNGDEGKLAGNFTAAAGAEFFEAICLKLVQNLAETHRAAPPLPKLSIL